MGNPSGEKMHMIKLLGKGHSNSSRQQSEGVVNRSKSSVDILGLQLSSGWTRLKQVFKTND